MLPNEDVAHGISTDLQCKLALLSLILCSRLLSPLLRKDKVLKTRAQCPRPSVAAGICDMASHIWLT